MFKHLVVGGLAILLAGCAMLSHGYEIEIKKEEQETEYASVYAEIIEFSGLGNREYQSELNMSIRQEITDAISAFDALAIDASKALPQGVKSTLKITQNVTRNTKDIVSFITEQYIYMGGAHGNTAWYPKTVYVTDENPHELTLEELFDDDGYMEKLNGIINTMVKENSDKYSELWAKPEITEQNQNRFYIQDDNLVIFFPPYELSYYAKGFIEFPIPLSDINSILDEDFRVE